MRYGLHGWFVVGAAFSVTAVLISNYLGLSHVAQPPQGDLQFIPSLLVLVLGVIVIRLLAGVAYTRVLRRSRPHTLFTPLYDQR